MLWSGRSGQPVRVDICRVLSDHLLHRRCRLRAGDRIDPDDGRKDLGCGQRPDDGIDRRELSFQVWTLPPVDRIRKPISGNLRNPDIHLPRSEMELAVSSGLTLLTSAPECSTRWSTFLTALCRVS